LEPSENEIITQDKSKMKQNKIKHFIQTEFSPGIFNNCYCFFAAAKLQRGLFSFQIYLCALEDRERAEGGYVYP